MAKTAQDVLNFWFVQVAPDQWFDDNEALDQIVRDAFLPLYESAARGELGKWEETPEGMLALILLLDQFPRRMFRGTARAYETDDQALDLARMAIIRHFDDRIDRAFKLFFYQPFQHSEQVADQRLALFYVRERTKDVQWLDDAEARLYVIQRFGRFPNRNTALGRETTAEEMAYLHGTPLPLSMPADDRMALA